MLTGNRAEYGILRPLIDAIAAAEDLELQLVVTGAHLAPAHGFTVREIEQDGIAIAAKVEMLLDSDTPAGAIKSLGIGTVGLADCFQALSPDYLILLGDRYELLAAASAAIILGIPIGHIHGGELSQGAIDESIRHALTKLAHLHFTAADAYRRRVIQLGESPERVFNVGALAIDRIRAMRPRERAELEAEAGVHFGPKTLLVTYHPATRDRLPADRQIDELLAALARFPDVSLIVSRPNADPGHAAIAQRLEEFASMRDNAVLVNSLGHINYLSCLQLVDGVVGNSSSGLIEAPAVGAGTVNIGCRQDGRLRASSVIDCDSDRYSIEAAIERLFTADFQSSLASVQHPYGDGTAAQSIVRQLRRTDPADLHYKRFHDLSDAVTRDR